MKLKNESLETAPAFACYAFNAAIRSGGLHSVLFFYRSILCDWFRFIISLPFVVETPGSSCGAGTCRGNCGMSTGNHGVSHGSSQRANEALREFPHLRGALCAPAPRAVLTRTLEQINRSPPTPPRVRHISFLLNSIKTPRGLFFFGRRQNRCNGPLGSFPRLWSFLSVLKCAKTLPKMKRTLISKTNLTSPIRPTSGDTSYSRPLLVFVLCSHLPPTRSSGHSPDQG